MNKSYDTLSEAITGLRHEGYKQDFNILNDGITQHAKTTLLSPDDFEIDIIYRFEGNSNPDDQCILYGISSKKHGSKGVLVNGYGISADTDTNDVIARLHLNAV